MVQTEPKAHAHKDVFCALQLDITVNHSLLQVLQHVQDQYQL